MWKQKCTHIHWYIHTPNSVSFQEVTLQLTLLPKIAFAISLSLTDANGKVSIKAQSKTGVETNQHVFTCADILKFGVVPGTEQSALFSPSGSLKTPDLIIPNSSLTSFFPLPHSCSLQKKCVYMGLLMMCHECCIVLTWSLCEAVCNLNHMLEKFSQSGSNLLSNIIK